METQTGGLVLEGKYALALTPLAELPAADSLVITDHDNERFLKTNSVWHEPADVEELDGVGLELRRQDLKLSLLMDMVSELVASQRELPFAVSIQLTASELHCEHSALPVGSTVEANLYLIPCIPRALKLYGEIRESTEPGWLVMRFKGMSPAVQDRMEKLIFTHHRRRIAHALADS